MTSAPAYGWYGDDFTGATDTLATIARRGYRAFLFLSIPGVRRLAEVGELDAIGIAGAARAMAPATMEEELQRVGRFFRESGVSLLHYKCCSTFDSAASVGNIATAITTLRRFVNRPIVPVLGGQPSLGRYCAFSNLFAAGNGSVHRLDRHPTMSSHPSTPMSEADLARHLEALGLGTVAGIHWPAIETRNIQAEWDARSASSPDAILFDVLSDTHLDCIGAFLRATASTGSRLAVGASSVAEAWFSQDIDGAQRIAPSSRVSTTPGPALGFVGSLSPLTRIQVDTARSYRLVHADPREIMTSDSAAERVVNEVSGLLREGRNVLVSTVPAEGDARVEGNNGGTIADRSAVIVDRVLKKVPVKRVAIAGGDTSSRIAQGLGFWGLSYHSQISNGVALCQSRSEIPERDRMLLMLKGGQMGDVDLFERFLTA
jgi:3-oxoisoapionate kinase